MIDFRVAFRLLPYQIEIAVEDEHVARGLAYLATRADQPRRTTATMRYDVLGSGPYDVLEDGDHLATVGTPDDVLYVVYGRCYARLLDHMSLGGWVALHAGIVRIRDRRALVIGEKGAGKTTLLLRLLYDGHAVEGDEVVFTRGGAAISQPRNFHVKPPTRDLIPELAPIWSSLPTTAMSDGLVIRAFDPAAVGFPWSVSEAPIDAVFVLHPAHGGAASCRGTSSVHGIAAAVANALPTGLASSRVVQASATLLGDVAAHELDVGDVAATASLVVEATVAAPSPRAAGR